jgi:large subunit ribosomal protein L30
LFFKGFASFLVQLAAMEPPIKTLFITLKRSFAGTRDSHVRVLQSLGLSRREQTIERANNASIRGAIDKVKYMLSVETDLDRQVRLAAEAAAKAPREPIRVRHTQQQL